MVTFVVGFLIGAIVGLFISAILVAGGDDDGQ